MAGCRVQRRIRSAMKKPETPPDEDIRIDALRRLGILDTSFDERFDRLTRLAKHLFGVPIALVSLVDEDRQWFKSCQGLDASETPRDISFCGHAILGDDVFLIQDAALDTRFHDNPLVIGEPHIRFYAGCPLTVTGGNKIGTLCVIDRKPREFGADELALLRDLAHMVELELVANQLATLDELTGISNRRGFEQLALHALGLCKRLKKPASLLYFDLDLFKQINDRFGHAEGDLVLSQFARLLKQTFRESDVLGRLGGDEFAVLLTNAAHQELNNALRRLQQSIKQYNHEAQRGYDIVYSVGAVLFDATRHADVADLLVEADALMYEQKKQTRERTGTAPGYG